MSLLEILVWASFIIGIIALVRTIRRGPVLLLPLQEEIQHLNTRIDEYEKRLAACERVCQSRRATIQLLRGQLLANGVEPHYNDVDVTERHE